jgi:hypothetical protein
MSYTATSSRLSNAYLILLLGILLGYAFLGKGFAYLGLPPLFIGEIALLIGMVILLRTRLLVAALATLPSFVLAVTMTWIFLCTLPFIDEYGFDALRDSVVIMYGWFAFIVLGLLLEDARRIRVILHYYRRFIKVYVPSAFIVFLFEQYMDSYIPYFPGTGVPVLQVRPGESAAHLVGAAVFALVGFCRPSRIWVVILVTSLAIVGGVHRGAMVAEIVPIAVAALMLGRLRESVLAIAAGLMILSAVYALEMTFTDHSETQIGAERQINTIQIVGNIKSIFGRSDFEALEGTKTWRLDWWDIIVKDTVYGPHFWSGRGFGLNLADADGFQNRRDPNSPPLRNPHSVHMTMLARAGVPGLVMWLLFLVTWLGMMTNAIVTAQRHRHSEWAGLFLFIGCYVMSIVIDASFDVALEGPMLGIWFWCLIGFGTGAIMIYRYQLRAVS